MRAWASAFAWVGSLMVGAWLICQGYLWLGLLAWALGCVFTRED